MESAIPARDTVDSLASRYSFDLAHTRYVADLALQIFDATRTRHGLPPRARALLETGALLHDIAFKLDEEHHHTLGRDILLASSLENTNAVDRAIIALMAAFHRKEANPQDEPVFTALKPAAQHVALVLAAIVRVADGLDYSHTQTTKIKSASGGELELRGPHCHEDAARAIRKADVWAGLTAKAQLPVLALRPRLTKPGLKPTDPMRTAAARIVRCQLDGIPQVDGTLPAEQVRKLRVAVRKLRVTMLAVHSYFKRKKLLAYMTDVREVLAAVSRTREWDMRNERLTASMTAGLAPLAEEWQRKRKKSHARLMAALKSPAASRMAQLQPARMLSKKSDAQTTAQFAQALIQRLMADVLAFEPSLAHASPEEMHRLRVAVRRLRMLLTAFKEILPRDQTKQVLKGCRQTQEILGRTHDAHMTAQVARAFALTRKGIPAAAEINAFADAQSEQSIVDVKALPVFEAIRNAGTLAD